jgi:hypothetical protein
MLSAVEELRVTTTGEPDEAELVSLRKWLSEAPDLRGVRVTAHRSTPEPGTMPGTGLVDAVAAVVTDKATLTAALSAIGGWLTARASMRRTRLRIKQGDREIEVDSTRVRDLDAAVTWMREQLDAGGHSDES